LVMLCVTEVAWVYCARRIAPHTHFYVHFFLYFGFRTSDKKRKDTIQKTRV